MKSMYLVEMEQRATGKETFKYYCRFIVKYRTDDISFTPWEIDFAKDVLDDIHFPKKSWYRQLINNSNAYAYYKQAIEKYLNKKNACNTAKEAFLLLWEKYTTFQWLREEYYETRNTKRKKNERHKRRE